MKKYKVCVRCKEKKKISLFPIARGNADGFDCYCRACKAEKKMLRTHAPGCKTYRRASGELHPLVSIDTYIIESCEVCDNNYYPRGPKYKKCDSCSFIANKIVYKSLVRYIVSNKTVTEVTKKYIQTNTCAYCIRSFTEDNPRWFDHIIPRCLGGNNEADNISICCRECNLSKAGLSLNQWIGLCRRVVEHNY